jgi:hypothetical protein
MYVVVGRKRTSVIAELRIRVDVNQRALSLCQRSDPVTRRTKAPSRCIAKERVEEEI